MKNVVCPRFAVRRFVLISQFIAVMVAWPGATFAAVVEMYEVPTNWKLENYVGQGPAAWFTSSVCNGNLNLTGATSEDMNRFFALILTAKIASRTVFVRYNNTDCSVVSFGMQSP